MVTHFAKRGPWILALLLSGCLHPVREHVDAAICALAAQPLDTQPGQQVQPTEPLPPGQGSSPTDKPAGSSSSSNALPATPAVEIIQTAGQAKAPGKATIPQQRPPQQPSAQQPGQPPQKLEERVRLPQELPGSRARLPVPGPDVPEEQRRQARRELFPALPPVPALPQAQPGPFGHPLTLQELQQLAMANSPLLRQAAADVEAAKGAVKQAGAYPNPNFGYEGDTVGTGSTAGFQGVFFEQIIKTAGKLKVAQASAIMNLLNTQLALRRAQTDLMAQVRSGYFAVLVAEQGLRWNIALSEFTERIYGIFVDNAILGNYTPYEPLALRAQAIQARATITQSQERYRSAWNQLAATLGLPGLPLTELAGHAEMRVPEFHHEAALERVLSSHTDVLTARNTEQRARYDLRTAEINPVPDLDVRVAIQKDFSMPPFNFTHSVQVGIPLPLWDQNRGNIQQAQGNLLRATEEAHRVRADLTTRLADAFERYEFNRRQAAYYRDWVLPDLARVYSASLLRFQTEVGAVFVDVVTNQQLYVTALATYAATLAAQWQAVSDVANLLQIDDVFMGMDAPPPVPLHGLEHLPGLPCSHPCDPLARP